MSVPRSRMIVEAAAPSKPNPMSPTTETNDKALSSPRIGKLRPPQVSVGLAAWRVGTM